LNREKFSKPIRIKNFKIKTKNNFVNKKFRSLIRKNLQLISIDPKIKIQRILIVKKIISQQKIFFNDLVFQKF